MPRHYCKYLAVQYRCATRDNILRVRNIIIIPGATALRIHGRMHIPELGDTDFR